MNIMKKHNYRVLFNKNGKFPCEYDINSCYFNSLIALSGGKFNNIKLNIRDIDKLTILINVCNMSLDNMEVWGYIKNNYPDVYFLVKFIESNRPWIKNQSFTMPDNQVVTFKDSKYILHSICMGIEGYVARQVIKKGAFSESNISIVYDSYRSTKDNMNNIEIFIKESFDYISESKFVNSLFSQLFNQRYFNYRGVLQDDTR